MRKTTRTGHSRDGCDDCRAYNVAYQAQRRATGLPDPDDPRHGSVTGYRACGCRCDDCKAAHRLRRQEERGRLTPAA